MKPLLVDAASFAFNTLKPLKNIPFCPIPVSDSNFNPQNTQCIPACPVGPADRTGVVKIFALTRGVHAPRPIGFAFGESNSAILRN